MKNVIIYFLSFSILSFGMQNTTMIAFFKINQDAIASKWCEKKDEPIKMCSGSCFLKKNLAPESTEKRASSTISNTGTQWIIQKVDRLQLQLPIIIIQKVSFSLLSIKDLGVLLAIFKPPS